MIYTAQKPPVTITYPSVQAFEVHKDLDTLANLQAFSITTFTLDIGPVGDTETFSIRFSSGGRSYNLYSGNVLVQLGPETFEVFENSSKFLEVYQVL